jgi:hypothetical protein
MNCPECGGKLGVIDSRAASNNSTRRRLKCSVCGEKFTSTEKIVTDKEENCACAPAIELKDIFAVLAKNSVVCNSYMSALTGGTYPTKEEAERDTVAELERIYNEQ